MAFRFGDTFDHHSTADRFKKWTQEYGAASGTQVISAGNGRRGTASARFSVVSTNETRAWGVVIPDVSGTTCIAQFAFRHGAFGFSELAVGTSETPAPANNGLLYIRYQGATQCWFRINDSGQIQAMRDTTTLGTASAALTLDLYHYIKIKVVIHNTTGTVTINLDGVDVLTLTSQDTQGEATAAWDEIIIGLVDGAQNIRWDYDDLIVLDGSGSFNNDFLEDQRGDVLLPNAVGNSNMSTPSGGAVDRYTMVDETSINDDTDYNTFAAVNDKDTYGFQNHPVSGSTIAAVQVCMGVRKEDAGTALVKAVARISAVDYDGTDKAVAVETHRYARQTWDRSPVDGTTAWTTATIDAAEFGLKKSA